MPPNNDGARPAHEARTRVDARGLTFDVHAGGAADGEPVLLLHGFPQHSGEWDLVLPALHAAGLRSYGLDQRGYSPGARPPAVADYAVPELVADAVAVLDALGVEAAHVVGHDWGAIVAWRLAAEHPDRVRTLTAVSVPHPVAFAHAMANDPDQRERSAYVGMFRQPGTAEEVLLGNDAAGLRRIFAGVGADRAERYVEPMLAPGALTAALNWYRALTPAGLAVGPVEVPTTFVWSDGDAAVGRTAAEASAAHVTGDYRFVVLSGVTHWIPDEAPDALAAAVLERIGRP
ncbi:alpha/beta hydrolase [Micromonospora sp. NPDC049559]|uniref:alpha/beta fold hydrolase n=1 Tax=Micromonospora sp. NPDC049559 TaxID=3155923 RepID=UPI003433F289